MMDANERLVLRNYLTCFESRKKGHKPKTLILFDLLERYKDDARIIQLLKKKVPTDDARRMLLARLQEKILASLTLDVNISRSENYDDVAQARASVAKGKIAAQLLIARGQREQGLLELQRFIEIAKRYELFHDLVEMLIISLEYSKTHKNRSPATELLNDITAFSYARDAQFSARNSFDDVVRQYGFRGLSRTSPEPARIAMVVNSIEQLQSSFEKTSASTIGYFYLLLKVEMHQLQGELKDANNQLFKLVQMVENNPAIKNRVRLATAYGNLAANQLWMHQFSSAEVYFKDALGFLRINSRNHALVTEYLFYAQFYSGNMTLAKATLVSLNDNNASNQSEFGSSMRNYLMACVEFCAGNHGNVRKFLTQSYAIGQDKEGWNIGSRLLGIINAIEQSDFDFADSLILNLKQFVREGLQGAVLRRRDEKILELLLLLRKYSYDFQKVYRQKGAIVSSLFSRAENLAWQVQTPELVCFHTWFVSKSQGKTYTPDYREEVIYRC